MRGLCTSMTILLSIMLVSPSLQLGQVVKVPVEREPQSVSGRLPVLGGQGKPMPGGFFYKDLAQLNGVQQNQIKKVATTVVKLMDNIKSEGHSSNTMPLRLMGIQPDVGTKIIAGAVYDLKLEILIDGKSELCHVKVTVYKPWENGGIWSMKTEADIDPCAGFSFSNQRQVRKKRSLLGGETEAGLNELGTQKAALWAVEHINQNSNSLYRHVLLRISHATKQVINGYRYRLSLTTVPTTCRNSPDNSLKTLKDCPASNEGKAQDCDVSVIFSLGKFSMESFKCKEAKNTIGGDDHDYKPHGKILGGDDHDYKPHGKILGGDNHDYEIHGKMEASDSSVSNLLGGDDHDYIRHGSQQAALMNRFQKHRKLNGIKFGSGHLHAVEHMSILGGDTHDYQPHGDSKCMQYREEFEKFKITYSRLYEGPEEEGRRFQVFCDNMEKVKEIQKNERGSAKYGVTKFADLSEEEFGKQYLGLKPSAPIRQLPQAKIPEGPIPASWDWREHKAVSAVKNQGSCGSCWAFSTTGNIEGQWAIRKNKLLSLSEQELVDCDKLDDGCNGGLPSNAYEAIMKLGGIETEKDYGYEGHDEKCKFDKSEVAVKLTGAVNISKDEEDMAKWLYHNGPISIGINAFAMQFYWGGIAHPWKIFCNPKSLDHGVLIVGYGVDGSEPYWIIKNSWGASWGREGYYYVYRGDGTCGLNTMCTSATVE